MKKGNKKKENASNNKHSRQRRVPRKMPRKGLRNNKKLKNSLLSLQLMKKQTFPLSR
jgi:hypothetical protein